MLLLGVDFLAPSKSRFSCSFLLHWSGTLFIGEAAAVAAVVMVHCSRCSAAAGVSLCTRVAFSCTDSLFI